MRSLPVSVVSSNTPCPIPGNGDSGRNKATLNGEPGTLNLLLTIRRRFGGMRRMSAEHGTRSAEETENDKKSLQTIGCERCVRGFQDFPLSLRFRRDLQQGCIGNKNTVTCSTCIRIEVRRERYAGDWSRPDSGGMDFKMRLITPEGAGPAFPVSSIAR